MQSSSIPTPWRVADVTYVEIEIRHTSERQIQASWRAESASLSPTQARLPSQPPECLNPFKAYPLEENSKVSVKTGRR